MLYSLRDLLATYNRGYIAERPVRSGFENFLSDLIQYQRAIKTAHAQQESEEHIKGIFKNFLQQCLDTKNNSYVSVNTAEYIDLAIFKNDIPEVLFEFKRPQNPEMVTVRDFNRKALHESIAYFYHQKMHGNLKIKHVIITDGTQFFFFDARTFGHKDLEKLCFDFYRDKLYIANKQALYDTLKKTIQDNDTIDFYRHCQDFDISHFANWANKNPVANMDYSSKDTFRMIQLYKVFHSDFLLWQYNPVDSNQLNKTFYNELLYILGLQEKTVKGTTTIAPTNKDGGLITEVLHKIKSETSLNPSDHLDKAFGLITAWLNRILFLKLFEGQLVAFNDNDTDIKFMGSDKIADFDTLNTLFFDILGTPVADRREKYKGMNNIPYLNSSLFEKAPVEQETGILISNIPDDCAMGILGNSVLKNRIEYSTHKPQKTLKYLLDFLDAYDFASTYTTDVVKDDTPEIINSSVLGLIFEKLNGYQDGSYYTPGHITEYMAEQSINRAVVQKYNVAFGWDCNDMQEVKNHMGGVQKFTDYQKYTRGIDSLTICDPAVGSGHFLVSVLNHIIALKSYLGLLWDGKDKIHDTVAVFNDVLHIYYQDDKPFTYKRHDRNTHQLQQVIFAEKKRIIENGLFAVDVNPNSVEICKLRLWIELLKHTYYYADGTMEILPNIDINVKCGDSLISKFPPKVGQSVFGDTPTPAQKQNIIKFRKLVHDYINTYGKQQKAAIKQQIDNVKQDIINTIDNRLVVDTADTDLIQAIEAQKKKFKQATTKHAIEQEHQKLQQLYVNYGEQKSGAILGDVAEDPVYKKSLEWMMEFPEVLDNKGVFIGFDIVIGNPPYIQLQKDGGALGKKYKTVGYESFASTGDIYALFYERGHQILSDKGVLCYITSNKWMRAGYGKNLRQYFTQHTQPHILIDIGPGVFESATVDTNILLFSKHNNTDTMHTMDALTMPSGFYQQNESLEKFVSNNVIDTPIPKGDEQWIILSVQEQHIKNIIEQKGTPLKDWGVNIYRGVLTGYNPAFIIDSLTRHTILSNCTDKDERTRTDQLIRPILRGKDIKKYQAHWADLWLIGTHNGYDCMDTKKHVPAIDIKNYPALKKHFDNHWNKLKNRTDKGITPYNLRSCNYWSDFFKPKIIYAEIVQQEPCFLHDIEKKFYPEATSFIMTGEHIKYLSAFLNSRPSHYFFKTFYAGGGVGATGVRYKKEFLNQLPIPQLSENEQEPLEYLVDYIQFCNQYDLVKMAGYFTELVDIAVFGLYFRDEMQQQECYINDGLWQFVKPLPDTDTDTQKQFLMDLYKDWQKQPYLNKAFTHYTTIEDIQIVLQGSSP